MSCRSSKHDRSLAKVLKILRSQLPPEGTVKCIFAIGSVLSVLNLSRFK